VTWSRAAVIPVESPQDEGESGQALPMDTEAVVFESAIWLSRSVLQPAGGRATRYRSLAGAGGAPWVTSAGRLV
jgi:hypothetical protein